jgi:hypothetical protein
MNVLPALDARAAGTTQRRGTFKLGTRSVELSKLLSSLKFLMWGHVIRASGVNR